MLTINTLRLALSNINTNLLLVNNNNELSNKNNSYPTKITIRYPIAIAVSPLYGRNIAYMGTCKKLND